LRSRVAKRGASLNWRSGMAISITEEEIINIRYSLYFLAIKQLLPNLILPVDDVSQIYPASKRSDRVR
jgi:hypothetical protein